MKTLKYKCTLLSDIILTQNAGTKTQQGTLDFIPGNAFLGIAASKLYGTLSPEESLKMFHSGHVRFGDAHPLSGNIRSLRIPAVYYYKKGENLFDDGAYIMYKWNPGDTQPKQCRNGFYTFDNDSALEIKTDKSVAIKSAYDRDKRRSKDEQMYSYESLRKGLEFGFEVAIDNDSLEKAINEALIGKRHIGHSKTSQYGLVEITADEEFVTFNSKGAGTEKFATVYADGRLIFIDKDSGMPTFQPTAEDLGFGFKATIDWEKSQIRTFQYAPWNAKRQTPDTDRCGIEKGSVFVVELNGTQSPSDSRYIGVYQCEGFGKVIYNPAFLDSDEEGRVPITFTKSEADKGTRSEDIFIPANSLNTCLLQVLKSRMLSDHQNENYKIVNNMVRKLLPTFKKDGEQFASQWGYIRNLAEKSSDFDKFYKDLQDYLDKGVTKDKWEFKKQELYTQIKNEMVNDTNWRDIMINLSAEMSKKCKQK